VVQNETVKNGAEVSVVGFENWLDAKIRPDHFQKREGKLGDPFSSSAGFLLLKNEIIPVINSAGIFQTNTPFFLNFLSELIQC
jgi:hypothetical protein